MFCNGPRMDEGDLTRPGPATIAGRASLEVLFVPNCGRHRRLIWAHQNRLSNGSNYIIKRSIDNLIFMEERMSKTLR